MRIAAAGRGRRIVEVPVVAPPANPSRSSIRRRRRPVDPPPKPSGPSRSPRSAARIAPPSQIDGANIPRVKKATAFLRVTAFDGEKMTGSGFFAMEPGLVFTNAHVVDMLAPDSQAPKSIEIVLNSGEPDEKVLQGKIVGVDRDHDLAIVKASGGPSDWPAMLAVDLAANCTELQDVYVFGFPFGANLGKNIVFSKSSISSLRKDDAGQLREMQVNGGMNPGNSGGPVVDTRGVVVGVAVSIVRGTQINFAVPAERVLELAAGRVVEAHLLDPYKAGDDIRLPCEVACLDPLQRIRKVDVDVWTGPAGPNRAGGTMAPMPVAGDGPRSRMPMTYAKSKAVAELALPTAKAGSVVWVQPILWDASGKSSWGTARSASLAELTPLTRQPATIRVDFGKVPERTIVLKNHVRLEMKKRDLASEELEVNLLELSKAGPDGGQTELWIGSLKRVIDVDGKRTTADPSTPMTRLKSNSLGWAFFPDGRSKTRRNLTPNAKIGPEPPRRDGGSHQLGLQRPRVDLRPRSSGRDAAGRHLARSCADDVHDAGEVGKRRPPAHVQLRRNPYDRRQLDGLRSRRRPDRAAEGEGQQFPPRQGQWSNPLRRQERLHRRREDAHHVGDRPLDRQRRESDRRDGPQADAGEHVQHRAAEEVIGSMPVDS